MDYITNYLVWFWTERVSVALAAWPEVGSDEAGSIFIHVYFTGFLVWFVRKVLHPETRKDVKLGEGAWMVRKSGVHIRLYRLFWTSYPLNICPYAIWSMIMWQQLFVYSAVGVLLALVLTSWLYYVVVGLPSFIYAIPETVSSAFGSASSAFSEDVSWSLISLAVGGFAAFFLLVRLWRGRPGQFLRALWQGFRDDYCLGIGYMP